MRRRYAVLTRQDRLDLSTAAARAVGLEPFLAQHSDPCAVTIDAFFHPDASSYEAGLSDLLASGQVAVMMSTAGYDKTARRDSLLGQLAAQLDVPFAGQPTRVTSVAMDKVATREVIGQAGLAIARGRVVESTRDLRAWSHEVGSPVLCKPIFGISGRGQFVVNPRGAIPHFDEPLLAEEFVDGVELSVDIFTSGQTHTLMPPVYKGPTSLTTNHAREKLRVSPMNWDPSTSAAVLDAAESIADIMQSQGWLNIDFIVTNDGIVTVLEVNARFSGTTRISAWTTGVNPYEISLRSALGLPWAQGTLSAVHTVLEVPLRQRANFPEDEDTSIGYSDHSQRFVGSLTTRLPEDGALSAELQAGLVEAGSTGFVAEFLSLSRQSGHVPMGSRNQPS